MSRDNRRGVGRPSRSALQGLTKDVQPETCSRCARYVGRLTEGPDAASTPEGNRDLEEAICDDIEARHGSAASTPPSSVCIFQMCLEGLHCSCIRYGPPPNTVGGSRVVCGCPCHIGQDPDWKPSDADRMATYFAFEHGVDPRVEQIVEGQFDADA